MFKYLINIYQPFNNHSKTNNSIAWTQTINNNFVAYNLLSCKQQKYRAYSTQPQTDANSM